MYHSEYKYQTKEESKFFHRKEEESTDPLKHQENSTRRDYFYLQRKYCLVNFHLKNKWGVKLLKCILNICSAVFILKSSFIMPVYRLQNVTAENRFLRIENLKIVFLF